MGEQTAGTVLTKPGAGDWAKRLYRRAKPNLSIFVALFILVVVASVLSPVFLQSRNVFNVLRQACALGVVSIGMTFVILSGNGGVDLSAGSTVSLVSCLAAGLMLGRTEPMWWVSAFTLAVGIIIGVANGLFITQFSTDPFITTLGMMTVVQGIVMTYTKGAPFGFVPKTFRYIAEGYVGSIPVPVLVFAALFVVANAVLRGTAFGRYVFALGGSEESARLSGIRTSLIKIAVYAISGFMAAVAGLILVARVSVGDPQMGRGFELDAIAACIIGGTTFAGGVGGLSGTLAGVLMIAIMNNLLNLLNVSPFSQQIVKGLIILGAIILQKKRRR